MMYPEDLKYNPEHTWLKMESNNTGRVGITLFAQEQLKEVVFVDLPESGTSVTYLEPFGTIESVKATNDLFSPVTGNVVEVNSRLKEEPGIVNQDPYGEGWMITIRLSDPSEINKLQSSTEYQKLLGKK